MLILSKWFWVAVVFVAFTFLYFLPRLANATEIPVYVYEEQNVTVRMMPSACADPKSLMILSQLLPVSQDRMKAIDSVWPEKDGSLKRYAGCWVELTANESMAIGAPETVVVAVFEDGGYGVVTVSGLKKTKGQIGV